MERYGEKILNLINLYINNTIKEAVIHHIKKPNNIKSKYKT